LRVINRILLKRSCAQISQGLVRIDSDRLIIAQAATLILTGCTAATAFASECTSQIDKLAQAHAAWTLHDPLA
jgi:hypothetical protein